MKRKLILLIVGFNFLYYTDVCFSQGIISKTNKPLVAVVDFRVISGVSSPEALALTSKFRSSLVKADKFTVLTRSDMEEILTEQNFSLSGCTTDECAVEIGQILSAEKIITGDIGKVGGAYTITVRLIDVTTSKIDREVDEEYSGKREGLLKVFDILAQRVAGTYKKSYKWWYVGGAVTAIAGIVVYILLKPEQKEEFILPEPPKP